MYPSNMPPRRGKKHNAAEGTMIAKNKRTRRLAEVMDASQTDSTTQQSESWECPISTRKHFIPDKVTISSRRGSLRSFKRFIETGITSSTCSPQPQKKSKKHSSNTDGVPKMRQEESEKVENSVSQVDIPGVMEDEVGEAEKEPLAETISKAYHVPEGSLGESPSKDLRQLVVHPLTLEPKMRHEERERVGSSVAKENFRSDTPEVMEQVSEAEDSFLNHLYKMEGQNKFDAQCILLEKEPQAPNNNHRKSTSTVAFSSTSFKLTEMANLMLDHEDVLVDSVTLDTIDGYRVKPELMPILRKIISKHGDIARNCIALTVKESSLLLERICSVILELQEKNFSKINEDFLRNKIALVNDLKNMKVEIEWLHVRLVEILEARKILNQCGMLKEKKESNRKTVENAKRKLKECREQKKEMKTKFGSLCDEKTVCTETLKRAMDESTRIDETIKYVQSTVRRFVNYSFMDD